MNVKCQPWSTCCTLAASGSVAGALAEFEASATEASQAAAATQGKAMVHVYRCNMSAAIQVGHWCHAAAF